MNGPVPMSSYDTGGRQIREAIVAALGGSCARCGESRHVRVLEIDHINADLGKQEKTAFGSGNQEYYQNIYNRLDSGDYQILCMNCNKLKSIEQQEHNCNMKMDKFLDRVAQVKERYIV